MFLCIMQSPLFGARLVVTNLAWVSQQIGIKSRYGMTTLVPMYHNTSSVLINPGYEPWIVIANQVFGGPPGYGSVRVVIGPPLVQRTFSGDLLTCLT